jgi:hypothetical protein
MDLRVHEFASGVADPYPALRPDTPYAYNGSSDKAHKPVTTTLIQREYNDEEPIEEGRKDISEKGIDENVHWFANPLTETLNWPRKETPYDYNGSSAKAHKNVLHQQHDISEKGIDENVHWFANPLTETLNWPRKETPYDYNGSGPKAHKVTLSQRVRRNGDLAETGMNEDVHDFVSNQPQVPRLPYPRENQPPAYNGSGPRAHKVTLYQRGRGDLAETGMNEDVHDFVSNQPQVPRLPYPRENQPPAYNGSGPRAHKVTLYQASPVPQQIKKKDISEKGINEEVHGFANSMVDPLPWPRDKEPPAYNGSGPKAHRVPLLQQRKKKDISEKGINEEVHGFANSMVDPLPWPRDKEPPAYNGSGPKAHRVVAVQKNDINNAEVRPDVYQVVSKIVNPVPLWRTNVAPKYVFEPWWGEGNLPPRTDLEPPACPIEDEVEAEPDLAKLKAMKIMQEEKKKDEEKAKAEEAKQDAALKKAEEEEKKAEEAKKALDAPPAAAAAAAPATAAPAAAGATQDAAAAAATAPAAATTAPAPAPAAAAATNTAKVAAPVPPTAVKAASTSASAPVPPKMQAKSQTPGKIVKLMTGDLIYDRENNLWRHEPVYVQQDE